ncbi:MAG: glycine cleavage system aminomethyltransferase GcvT [Flavobacteriaceae bacterium]
MKQTPLHHFHVALGAKMAPFGGYEMPIQYEGIQEEHRNVRSNVGVFDVSHMGEFLVEGPQAFSLLQHICSNDISQLSPGKAQYNYWPNGTGGVIDDLIVYQLDEQSYMLVVNASNLAKDWDWISLQNKNFQAKLSDISDNTVLLAVQGPKALEMLAPHCSVSIADLRPYRHLIADLGDCKELLIATTGYTGAGGVEIYAPKDMAEKLWETLMKIGEPYSLQPIGLGARDTLRLEMGYCLYGHELSDEISPIAAGLGWVTRENHLGIDQDQLGREKFEGTAHRLVGFAMEERGIPRQGYSILNVEGQPIGQVSSGTQSPSLNQGIGLGFVESDYSAVGSTIKIQIRKKQLSAKVVKLPFWKKPNG